MTLKKLFQKEVPLKMLPNKSAMCMLQFFQACRQSRCRCLAAVHALCIKRPFHDVPSKRTHRADRMTDTFYRKSMLIPTSAFPTYNHTRQCHGRKESEDVRKHIIMSPWKIMKSSFKLLLLKYSVDKQFNGKQFLDGATQAFMYVTSCLATTNHQDLQGLLTGEVMRKVNSYTVGTPSARIYSVQESDIINMFVSAIDIQKDMESGTDSRIAEITVVFIFKQNFERDFDRASVFDAVASMPEKLDYSNYRFIRHYRDNKAASDWMINHICHFTFQDMARNY